MKATDAGIGALFGAALAEIGQFTGLAANEDQVDLLAALGLGDVLGPLALPVSGAGTGAVGGLLVVILAGLLARLMPALRSLVHSRYGRGRSRERYWTISISLTRASNRGSDLSGANPE